MIIFTSLYFFRSVMKDKALKIVSSLHVELKKDNVISPFIFRKVTFLFLSTPYSIQPALWISVALHHSNPTAKPLHVKYLIDLPSDWQETSYFTLIPRILLLTLTVSVSLPFLHYPCHILIKHTPYWFSFVNFDVACKQMIIVDPCGPDQAECQVFRGFRRRQFLSRVTLCTAKSWTVKLFL